MYPTLKEVALAGSSGSKAMKQVLLQIMKFSIKAAGEGNQTLLIAFFLSYENRSRNLIWAILMRWLYAGIPDLSREAVDIFTWCLNQNPDCYQQWVSSFLLLFLVDFYLFL